MCPASCGGYHLWSESGLQADNPEACIQCVETALGRQLTKEDLDLTFWGNQHMAEYERGFKDAIEGYNSPPETQNYKKGRELGLRFYVNPHDPNLWDLS